MHVSRIYFLDMYVYYLYYPVQCIQYMYCKFDKIITPTLFYYSVIIFVNVGHHVIFLDIANLVYLKFCIYQLL